MVIGDTKGFINSKALSYEGHTHSEYAGVSNDSVPFRYITTAMSVNKYYKINILSTASWMYAFTIRVYQSYTYYDIVISGYNYGANHWFAPAATLIGSTADSIQVHFGYDSDYNLWVAIPAGNYTGLAILDSANGYRAIDPTFSIALIDSLPSTVQTSVTAYRPANINELNKYALSSTVNALSSKISKLEANVDVATLVASGSFSNYVSISNSSKHNSNTAYFSCYRNGTTVNATRSYYDGTYSAGDTCNISPVACSYIIFKYIQRQSITDDSTGSSATAALVEFKVKAGSSFEFIGNSANSTNVAYFSCTLSSDGKTLTIAEYSCDTLRSSEHGTATGVSGWYECYA